MSKKDTKTKNESKKKKLSTEKYEAEIYKLHTELVKLQYWVKESGHKVVVVFEGRDAAGKCVSQAALRLPRRRHPHLFVFISVFVFVFFPSSIFSSSIFYFIFLFFIYGQLLYQG